MRATGIPTSWPCPSSGGGRLDAESETLIPTIGGGFDVAHTLRADGFDASEDGTGRGTPLVPVLPFDTTQITSRENRANPQPGDPCHPLASGAHAPAIAFNARQDPINGPINGPIDCNGTTNGVLVPQMRVRRLMPVECERLQGFPPIAERVIVDLCIDHQSGLASVALQCLRWHCNASPADAEGLTPFVPTAAVRSSTSPANCAPLAVLHVLPRSEGDSAELRSHAKSNLSANGVNGFAWSHRAALPDSSVPALAHTLRSLAHAVRAGKVASRLFMMPSTLVPSGSKPVPMFGGEIAASAAGAASGPNAGTFTTSELGRLRPISDSSEATWCCSVLAAIAGCIPSETLPGSFSLELTVVTPYTRIVWRGKPVSECPDGPRYKALGNSWAVNCARWVGRRIAMVDSLSLERAA